jgi:hypothetical protein
LLSVTTLAVTPRDWLLIEEARLLSVLLFEPILIVVVLPPDVILKLPEIVDEALGSSSEYHDPVVARLFTTTVWFEIEVPSATLAVTTEEFELVALTELKPLDALCKDDNTSLKEDESVSS